MRSRRRPRHVRNVAHTHTHSSASAWRRGQSSRHILPRRSRTRRLANPQRQRHIITKSSVRACVRSCVASHLDCDRGDRPTDRAVAYTAWHAPNTSHSVELFGSGDCNGGYLQAHHQGVALQLRGESITIGGARGRTAISARARAIYNNIIISHIGVRRSAPLAESPHTTHRTHQNSAKTHLELLERARVASVRPSNRVIIIRTERSARHRFIARCTCACVRAGGQAEHMHRRFCSVRQVSAIALAALEPRHVVCVWYVNCLKYK